MTAKFGGTSVATAERWRTIREVVRRYLAEDRKVLVVCSAVAGISDTLEGMLAASDDGEPVEPFVQQVAERHHKLGRELGVDVADIVGEGCRRISALLDGFRGAGCIPSGARAEVMAVGELLSTRIGARWLLSRGVSVAWRDARELLTTEPSPHGACARERYLSATCTFEADEDLARQLEDSGAQVVVTQGFIARNSNQETVLLGRGGSDTAAAAFAAKIGAERLELWSDVPGVFSADPRRTGTARLLRRLTFDEAETLAGFGAGVIHAPCIHPARTAGVPIHLRWTQEPDIDRGTRVGPQPEDGGLGIKAVVSRNDIALFTMSTRAGWQPLDFMPDVTQCFKQHAVALDLVSSSSDQIQATVDLGHREGIRERLPALLEDLREICDTTCEDDVSSVSLVGHGVRDTMYEYGPKLEILKGREIRMVSAGASNLHFTFVVPDEAEARLLRELHRELFEEVELNDDFGPTWEELDGSSTEVARSLLAEPVPAS